MQGLLGAFCFYYAKRSERKTGVEVSLKNKYLFAWWFLWVFFAVMRFVNPMVGGTDAPSYIDYFMNCNTGAMKSWYEHVEGDLGFKWLTKICRYVAGEYRFYFFVVYGFIAFAFIKFLKAFTPAKTNVIPFLLTFYLFLRGYNTLRSNLAIALIAIGCIFIIEKKWKYAYLIGFASVLIHKSAIIYAMGIPFCHCFFERKLSIKMAVFLILGSSLIGRTLQGYFIEYAVSTDLNGAYASYAQRSIGVSFFSNAWKIAFEQMVLALTMLLMRKKIGRDHDAKDLTRLNVVWMLCIFDFILIPINFIIGSWRGYEFFYLARLVMWGACCYQLLQHKTLRTRLFLQIMLLCCFVSWMAFRIYSTWEDSHLLPYVFEPFLQFN